jgi:hypothetical protein
MDLDTKIPSKGTLLERIAELEELETTGAATPLMNPLIFKRT